MVHSPYIFMVKIFNIVELVKSALSSWTACLQRSRGPIWSTWLTWPMAMRATQSNSHKPNRITWTKKNKIKLSLTEHICVIIVLKVILRQNYKRQPPQIARWRLPWLGRNWEIIQAEPNTVYAVNVKKWKWGTNFSKLQTTSSIQNQG